MAYAPAALRWLATEWEAAIGSAVFSGIVGDAAHTYGYHRAANEIPASDYSRQLVGDRDVDGIDMYAADAIDMSMSRADMILVTGRIYRSWIDQADPRLNWWREAIGTLDGSAVIYMDCQLAQRGTADNSHLWHVHCGGLRVHANNMDAMVALLSVIRGETVAQWQSGGADMALAPEVETAFFVNYDGYHGVSPNSWFAKVLEKRLGNRLDELHTKVDARYVEEKSRDAAAATAIAGLRTVVDALAAALKSGGSDLDTAAVLSRVDQLATASAEAARGSAEREQQLLTQLAEVEQQLAAYRQAEADAQRAAADLLDAE